MLALNWHVPKTAIDIVAKKKHEPVALEEVKYRQSDNQGGVLDYTTPVKLSQMKFAVELWIAENPYDGEYVLAHWKSARNHMRSRVLSII